MEYAGRVTVLAPDTDPPRDGISFRADDPMTLYVNGIAVGVLATHPSVNSEWLWEIGKPTPQEFAVVSTQLHCWLELPYKGDVP